MPQGLLALYPTNVHVSCNFVSAPASTASPAAHSQAPLRSNPATRAARPMLGIALLVLAMWTLSGLDASGKWLMAVGVPLMVLSWVRYVVHVVLVLGVVLPMKGRAILHSQRPRDQLLRGVTMFSSTMLFFTALRYLPQAEGTAINFLAPMLVLALAPWLLKEAPRLSRWVAVVVALIGVLVVIRPSGGLDPVGVMFGLLTACCMAANYIATRRVAVDDPLTSLIWGGVAGAVFSTVALPFVLPAAWDMLMQMSTLNWLVLISTGVTGALGHLLQIGAYRQASASMLSPFLYLQIISATAVGWMVWGHFPDPLTWLGIGIIVASGATIGYVEWRRSRAQ